MAAKPTLEERFRAWRATHQTDRNLGRLAEHEPDVFVWEADQPVPIGRVEREQTKSLGGFIRWNGYCQAACHGVLPVTDELSGADSRDGAVEAVTRAHWYAAQGWSCSRIRTTLERMARQARETSTDGR